MTQPASNDHAESGSRLDGIDFAHPSERVAAEILDFYRIRWEYEPTTFPIEWDGEGKVIASFTPDFYLPDFELYIELTTMSQKLVTKKNRKVRRLKELHPGDQREDLLPEGLPQPAAQVRHTGRGEGPSGRAADSRRPLTRTAEADGCTLGRIESSCDGVLIEEARLQAGVARLGAEIARDYAGRGLRLVTVLKGGLMFLADLCRAVELPVQLDFMAVSSYQGGAPGAVRITKDLDDSIEGASVLVVEDIIDTGLTLNYVLSTLRSRGPEVAGGLRAARQGRQADRRSAHRVPGIRDTRIGSSSGTVSILPGATATCPTSPPSHEEELV